MPIAAGSPSVNRARKAAQPTTPDRALQPLVEQAHGREQEGAEHQRADEREPLQLLALHPARAARADGQAGHGAHHRHEVQDADARRERRRDVARRPGQRVRVLDVDVGRGVELAITERGAEEAEAEQRRPAPCDRPPATGRQPPVGEHQRDPDARQRDPDDEAPVVEPQHERHGVGGGDDVRLGGDRERVGDRGGHQDPADRVVRLAGGDKGAHPREHGDRGREQRVEPVAAVASERPAPRRPAPPTARAGRRRAAARSSPAPQPQRHVGGLDGLAHDAAEVVAERLEVDLVAQARAEGLERARGVVAAAVEAAVDRAPGSAPGPDGTAPRRRAWTPRWPASDSPTASADQQHRARGTPRRAWPSARRRPACG